jgi:hypothetical protein
MVKKKRQVLGNSWFFFAGTVGRHGGAARINYRTASAVRHADLLGNTRDMETSMIMFNNLSIQIQHYTHDRFLFDALWSTCRSTAILRFLRGTIVSACFA